MVECVAADLLCGIDEGEGGAGGDQEGGPAAGPGRTEVGLLEWLKVLLQDYFACQKESGLQMDGDGMADDERVLDMSWLGTIVPESDSLPVSCYLDKSTRMRYLQATKKEILVVIT